MSSLSPFELVLKCNGLEPIRKRALLASHGFRIGSYKRFIKIRVKRLQIKSDPDVEQARPLRL
jgi:hypothetical protein